MRKFITILFTTLLGFINAQKAFITQVETGYAFTSVYGQPGQFLSGGVGLEKNKTNFILSYGMAVFGYDSKDALNGEIPIFDNINFDKFPFQNLKFRNDELANLYKGYVNLSPKLYETRLNTIDLSIAKELGSKKWRYSYSGGIKHSVWNIQNSDELLNLFNIFYNGQKIDRVLVPVPVAFKFYDFGAVFRVGLAYAVLDNLLIETKLRYDYDIMSANNSMFISLGFKSKVDF
jgi:hypothetical protein